MKKLYAFFAAIIFSVTISAQDWNISDTDFNSLGEITATTTINGLTIYAAADKAVTIDENSKTVDGVDYTHRMKSGGSGSFTDDTTPYGRVYAFDVDGDTEITVVLQSSSSASDRKLAVSAGSESNIIGELDAFGDTPSKQTITYTGGATTIYLYSTDSGVNVYHIMAAPVNGSSGGTLNDWNISEDAFNALGDITQITTVEGLTIHATADKTVTIDANGKSLDGIDYTHRLKLGGSGTFDVNGDPESRIIAFPVDGSTKITIMCMSSSSSADRVLNVAAGSEENMIGTADALGTELTKSAFDYTGEATTIYLWSPSSGVNIYRIIVGEDPTTSIVAFPTAEGRVIKAEYYSISGVNVGNNYNALPAGIYILKEMYENGVVKTAKISKARK